MAYKGYQFRCANQAGFFAALQACMTTIGWTTHVNGFKAYTTLTAAGNCANTNTLTLDGKVYTIKSALTPAEGEILLGGTAADTLTNIQLAINRTNPGTNDGVKYKVAAAHPTMSAENLTATTLIFQALTAGVAGNSLATTKTLANMTLTGTTLANGSANMVYKSKGESGNEPYGYVYIVSDGTGITFYCYQYWDETLIPQGTGAYRLATTSGSYNERLLQAVNFTSANECFIGGDKDMVNVTPYMNVSTQQQNPYYGWGISFGHISRRFNTPYDPLVTTNPLTSGNNVTISVSDTSKIVTGAYIQIMGKQASTFEGCDQLRVQSVTNGTDFVVDNVPRNYVAGAFIGNPASVFGYAIESNYQGASSGRFYPCCFWTDAAKSVSANYYTFSAMIGATGISGRTLKSYLSPYWVTWDILVGYIKTPFLYPGGIAAVFDALIANNDLSIPTQYTCTSATNNTLTDAGRAWTPHALIGKFVVLTVGTGNSQARLITENDATSITVDNNWILNPDATTNYKICDVLYRVAIAYAGYNNYVALKVTNTSIPA